MEFAAEGELDLMIATDCISEGQNLQDGDYLVNYDIHWNPVRIIQRFGRIDRIGSPNAVVQLVNFWPNMAFDEYIGLKQRVSGRMVLLDISATGEENLIERDAGNLMNDLEYRRTQLQKMQETVIDLEDLSSGISIADLTLADYRIELAGYLREHPGSLATLPLGAYAVTSSAQTGEPFAPGGTHACTGEFAGMGDFEVVAFLVVVRGVRIRWLVLHALSCIIELVMKVLTLKIPAELDAMLQAASRASGLSKSAIVRQALEQSLYRRAEKAEAARHWVAQWRGRLAHAAGAQEVDGVTTTPAEDRLTHHLAKHMH